MDIVWDEPKRLANLAKHGLDFADIDDFDWSTALVVMARESLSGRCRFKTIGRFRNGTAVVIFATLRNRGHFDYQLPAGECERKKGS